MYVACTHFGGGPFEQLHELQLTHWWAEFVNIAARNENKELLIKSSNIIQTGIWDLPVQNLKKYLLKMKIGAFKAPARTVNINPKVTKLVFINI